MQQNLFQLQNNEVIICNGNKVYQDTFENFCIDYRNSLEKSKFDHVIYNQTLKVHVINHELQESFQSAVFDQIINDIDTILQKQIDRQPKEEISEEPVQQDNETIDPAMLDLAEAVLELSNKVEKLEGSSQT
ncbi:hypothetical protein [Anaerosinus massiliensis]|uniref:hypothetical protein n=1 Tax=Massilibacillus massiliensis TaxID=1806837 RepID=UPI000DA6321E|nr:hypothetical protein [Massilibacillus massiliensis]